MRPVNFPDIPVTYDENAIKGGMRKYIFGKTTSETIDFLGERQRQILEDKLAHEARAKDNLDFSALATRKKRADDILDEAPTPKLTAIERPNSYDQNYLEDYSKDNNARSIELKSLPNLNEELASLRKVFTPDYGKARRELISLIGQYCSYCESPVGSRLAIEHRLPIHYFPHLGYRWSNFLLACDSCNSIKGAKPNQWTKRIGARYQDMDDAAARFNDVENFAWPHLLAGKMPEQDIAQIPFLVKLCHIETPRGGLIVGKKALEDKEIASFISEFRKGTLVPKEGYFEVGDRRTKLRAAAGLFPNPASPIRQDALQEMIDMLDLNRVTGKNGIASIDRRVELRTLAMFTAYSIRYDLDMLYEHRPNAAEREQWGYLIADLFAVTGFWTVWMNILPERYYKLLAEAFPGTLRRYWAVNRPAEADVADDEDVPMDGC